MSHTAKLIIKYVKRCMLFLSAAIPTEANINIVAVSLHNSVMIMLPEIALSGKLKPCG